jgi:tRNA A-37 threonylcarbamoyl transferase component Bud32
MGGDQSGKRGGGGRGDEAISPTLADPSLPPVGVGGASPTPQPLKDRSPISSADTAVATKSQAMAALAAEEAPEDTLVNTLLLGRYEITRKIGQGGMGAVYEATHKLIGKRMAVKVLLDKYAQKDQIVARLEQEARLASSIGHEHIIDITDFGTTADGRTFVVMEFLDGESLGATLARVGRLDEQRAIRIGHQIASALGAAHKKGVVHRDVKPDNVFLLSRRGKDFVKVVDFGISKAMRPEDESGNSPRLTQTGMVLGTPLYMSPEQARGDENLDHRIDVYALGVILYEMVTGEVPFRGNNYLNILTQVINEEPRAPRDLRPDLSVEFEAIIMKALAKDRDERYANTDELADDLAVLMTVDGLTTGRARITAQKYKKKLQNKGGLRILLWAAGIAVLAAAVVFTVRAMMGDDDKPAEKPTQPIAGNGTDPTPEQPDDPPEKPALEVVEIPIKTIPQGATIYHQDRVVCEKTPCKFPHERVNTKIALVAELAGHDDSEFTVDPFLDAKNGATVRLKKVKKGAERKIIPKGTKPPAGDGTRPPDKGGKDAAGDLSGDPYKKKPQPQP